MDYSPDYLPPVSQRTTGYRGEELGRPNIAQASESEPAHLRMVEWLHEREGACRYLLYQADQLVIVGDSAATTELGEIETRLANTDVSRSLLLLHPPELSRPSGTHRWLAERGVDSVYQLDGHWLSTQT